MMQSCAVQPARQVGACLCVGGGPHAQPATGCRAGTAIIFLIFPTTEQERTEHGVILYFAAYSASRSLSVCEWGDTSTASHCTGWRGVPVQYRVTTAAA